ncbi:riboflavin kinase-like [Liolophura sinensis]|uniref:riboflavin kinase-like n=1 Tax=Liolophura sinensis TaxID=3198878 RepID=UPI003158E7D4
MAKYLPYFAEGEVVKGFGRGSKELGIPTANFPDRVVEALPKDIPCGVYYGWAMVDNGPVHKMVLSIGWNPFYKNQKKTMETHVLHKFKDDFYGSTLKVVMLGYVRPMENFSSVDELIKAIRADIAETEKQLKLPKHEAFKDDNFFKTNGEGS